MLINPNIVLPSQDFLKPQTISFIFECLEDGHVEALPPSPIVRKDSMGNYIAIDGHNLLAVRAFRNESTDVHLAGNKHDGLPETSVENKQRNTDLLEKFDMVIELQKEVEKQGIHSLHDLIERNRELFQVTEDPKHG